ncbi:MAG: AbrB/MazE/SpoVT family DNA-binding domain-containing protein [Hyphomicrobium sp.]|nr:AbrB/MazE/SpoVT family DNA-binding domain-containing protein [Hyphomicrobium sp.]
MRLQIKKIGNSTGLILPKELLQRLGLEQGDEVIVSQEPDGLKIRLTEDDFERGLEIARKAMKKYRSALRVLAK